MSDQPRYVLAFVEQDAPVPVEQRVRQLLKEARRLRLRCVEGRLETTAVSFGEFRAAVAKLRAAEKREDLTPAEGREQVALRARVDAMLSELNESDLPPEGP